MTETRTARSEHPARRRLSPEPLFLIGAISQYCGASIAHTLFRDAPAAAIGWLRVLGAVIVLVPVSARRWRGWPARNYGVAALFGCITVGMNLTFYVAIDHLPLGSGVAIEFIGPITVAAIATRTPRNAGALVLATSGVLLLSGTEIGDDAFGLLFIFLAAALWAGYIVLGARLARRIQGTSALALGLAVGLVLSSPIGFTNANRLFGSPHVLLLGLAVGVLSSAIPYGIDQTVLRNISVRRFAVLQALLPVVATAIGFVALDQRPSLIEYFGILLVVSGVAAQDRS